MPGAIIRATLTYHDECIFLSDEAGEYPAIWPQGTQASLSDRGRLEVQLPGGETVGEGDVIEVTGGIVPAAAIQNMNLEGSVELCTSTSDSVVIGGIAS